VPRIRLAWLLMGLLGLSLGGCMQATLAPSSDASFTPKDQQLLAQAPYAQANIPERYRRHVVDYPYKEGPGSILVDTDSRYLYYVLPNGKAIRYGVAVGEEALVGNSSTLLDGVKIGVRAMVAAGSLVTPGTEIPDGMLAMGAPCKVKGPLAGTAAERWVQMNPAGYQALAQRHRKGVQPA